MIKNNLKIFISATEQSGDNIGYHLIKEILKTNDQITFEGVGGKKMSSYLNTQFFSLKDFNTMGIFEVLFSIRKFIKMIKYLANIIKNNNYDLIVTIDSPDFNYPLVKEIKKNKYKNNIIHIVAPTVWAWREYRAKNFAKIYNHMFTIFNFENSFFEKYKLKSTFVGHPIFYIKKNSNKFKKNLVAFLPGSRLGEIKSLFTYFELAYEKLLDSNYKYHIFIPTLPHLKKEIINRTKKWKLKTIITTKKNEIENYYSKTNIALVCSGTASLEIAKREIPQLIIYKLNYFTELIASFLIKIKYANIVNIIANKMIIPELVNSKLNKRNFKIKFEDLLKNKKSNSKQIIESRKIIRKLIQKKSPYKKIVAVIIKII